MKAGANLALFDFDGTITQREMFIPFMEFVTPKWRLYAGRFLLFPLIFLYRFGLFPAPKLRVIANFFVFFGRKHDEVFKQGQRFAHEVIPQHLREHALARLQWHKDQGDEVVLVSASLNAYLSHWCKTQGIALICSELEVNNGKLSGFLVSGDCSNKAKKEKVTEQYDLSKYNKIYAYGDTPEDLAMLSLACEQYMNWQKVN